MTLSLLFTSSNLTLAGNRIERSSRKIGHRVYSVSPKPVRNLTGCAHAIQLHYPTLPPSQSEPSTNRAPPPYPSLPQLDTLIAHVLARLERRNVALLRNLPRRHDALVLAHAVEVAREAELCARLAAAVDKVRVEAFELGAARGKVLGDVAAEGVVGARVGFHLAEVEVRCAVVELGGRLGRDWDGWELEATC
jgi:hypothetical protein